MIALNFSTLLFVKHPKIKQPVLKLQSKSSNVPPVSPEYEYNENEDHKPESNILAFVLTSMTDAQSDDHSKACKKKKMKMIIFFNINFVEV